MNHSLARRARRTCIDSTEPNVAIGATFDWAPGSPTRDCIRVLQPFSTLAIFNFDEESGRMPDLRLRFTFGAFGASPRRAKNFPNLQPPTSNLQPPTSNLQPPTSNLQPPTSNLQPLQPQTAPTYLLTHYLLERIFRTWTAANQKTWPRK